MASNTGTLYIGVTGNLARRVIEHKDGVIEGFSKKYNTKNLVYCSEFKNIKEAIEMEKRIKKWSRNKKLELIRQINPSFKDLSI